MSLGMNFIRKNKENEAIVYQESKIVVPITIVVTNLGLSLVPSLKSFMFSHTGKF